MHEAESAAGLLVQHTIPGAGRRLLDVLIDPGQGAASVGVAYLPHWLALHTRSGDCLPFKGHADSSRPLHEAGAHRHRVNHPRLEHRGGGVVELGGAE